jgi:glycosyltransferase involved in cell wall biosynthesis
MSTKHPTVSVVIATYNYGRYLAGAIDSVLAQTFQDFEIIVVDDGSTDDTPAVLQRYTADRRVRFFHETHRGHPQAKNRGLNASRGSFIGFLDADDEWLPTKLQKQVERFGDDRELGVVFAQRSFIDERGVELALKQSILHRGWISAPLLLDNGCSNRLWH